MSAVQGSYPYGMARENYGTELLWRSLTYYVGSSIFLRLLPYLEQQVLASL